MAKCTAYYSVRGQTGWKGGKEFVGPPKAKEDKHAERLGYSNLSVVDQSQDVYLFVQDEFPCETCFAYFVNMVSDKTPLIFVCKGSATYAGVWGLANPPMPQVIYVYKKKIALPGKVVTTQWVAPDPSKPYVGQKQQVTVLNAINPENCQKPDGFPDHPSLAAHLA